MSCSARVRNEAMRLRFPKSARLAHAHEFQRLKREGVSLHGKLLVMSVLKGLPSPEPRVGLITSRRVGGAVVRNRIRRRLREIFRHDSAHIQPGVWLVLIARQHAARATFDALREEWRRLGRKAGIFADAVWSS